MMVCCDWIQLWGRDGGTSQRNRGFQPPGICVKFVGHASSLAINGKQEVKASSSSVRMEGSTMFGKYKSSNMIESFV
jgi:hypothetical protein